MSMRHRPESASAVMRWGEVARQFADRPNALDSRRKSEAVGGGGVAPKISKRSASVLSVTPSAFFLPPGEGESGRMTSYIRITR